jgi:endogenous inhibitor of DNA gyrase (YacG/DUF329 family)
MTLMTPLEPARGLTSWRSCDNCGKPIESIPSDAPHKRFCSAKCRDQWHYQARKATKATKANRVSEKDVLERERLAASLFRSEQEFGL